MVDRFKEEFKRYKRRSADLRGVVDPRKPENARVSLKRQARSRLAIFIYEPFEVRCQDRIMSTRSCQTDTAQLEGQGLGVEATF